MPQSIRPTTSARAAVFAPLAGGGRAELVEQRLTDAIILGLLSHAEKLPSENEMARQFGVATVTAREALVALRVKGLVETKRGRDGGSFVVSKDSRGKFLDAWVARLSRVELQDMGVHYSSITGMAAELAADRATRDDVAHLLRVTEDTDVESESSSRRGEGTFRLEVAALSQSARLVREELRLQAEFAPLLWLCLRDEEYRRLSRESHLETIEAIAAFDGHAARTLTTTHINSAIVWLLNAKAERERRT
ncbi:MAG: FadR/GntR family transcriptional regulator [Microbacteriaceae bacterium]